MLRKRTALLLAVLILSLLPCGASAQSPVVMVFGEGYRPFYSEAPASAPGRMQGAFIDFLTAFESANPRFPVRRVILSRIRTDQWMQSGEADAFSLNNPRFVAPDLRARCLFTAPLWVTTDHIVVRRTEIGIGSADDLRGKRLAVIRGNGYGPLDESFARGDIVRVDTNSSPSSLLMLDAGRVDAAIVNRHSFPTDVRQAGLDPERFRLIKEPVLVIPLHVQVRAERRDFFDALNAFIETATKNGLLHELEAAHVEGKSLR